MEGENSGEIPSNLTYAPFRGSNKVIKQTRQVS